MQSGAVDRHTPWHPSAERDALDPELAALLRKVLPMLCMALNAWLAAERIIR